MTPEQIALVQTSFAQVLPIADAAGTLFYGRLFELDPSLKPLFTGDIQEQARKLMTMLKVVVNGLHRIDQLMPAVQELGRRSNGPRRRLPPPALAADAILVDSPTSVEGQDVVSVSVLYHMIIAARPLDQVRWPICA